MPLRGQKKVGYYEIDSGYFVFETYGWNLARACHVIRESLSNEMSRENSKNRNKNDVYGITDDFTMLTSSPAFCLLLATSTQ